MVVMRPKMLQPRSQQILVSSSDRIRPKMIQWKGVYLLRQQSFNATVREIIEFSNELDVVKVGIIGDMSSGKSTMSEAIAHTIHTKSKVPYAIRKFDEDDLLDFEQTLKQLSPANYILIFDDVSFLEASANKQQVSKVKQAVTKIRHLPGGQNVKIILIYNYHYSLGLDKFLRQADFKYFTTVGSSEIENMEATVGTKKMKIVHDFIKHRRKAVSSKEPKFWTVPISAKESCMYKWRNPFIPALFWNTESVREIISPTRQWLDPICSVCTGSNGSFTSSISNEQFLEESEAKFTKPTFQAVVKQKLKELGIANTYSKKFVQAQRYLDRALMRKEISLEEIAVLYDLHPTNTKLNKKLDGVLLSQDSTKNNPVAA